MTEALTAPRLPIALRIAQLACALPDFPGRDTLLLKLQPYALRMDEAYQGTFSGGLKFEAHLSQDGNDLFFFLMRYSRPSLAPLFDAALSKGGVYADAGGNLGVYTLWAARIVGPTGSVHAFEPVPGTFARLVRNIELNNFDQVTAVNSALGADTGMITLYRVAAASGLSSRYFVPKENPTEVPVTTLDAYFEGKPIPQLIKVDVEGMELEVLMGAKRLLSGPTPPVVVFESNAAALASAGTNYGEVISFLGKSAGFSVWSLTTRGLQRDQPGTVVPIATNALAARPDLPAHARILETLKGVRFAHNQTL